MTQREYQLDNTQLKTTEPLKLWESERGFVEIEKDTLAMMVKMNDKKRGYVFHGFGKLLLDAIVETVEGAVGKPVEKEVREPFLMIGDTESIQPHLSQASSEDLARMGYENPEAFLTRADELLDRFFRDGGMHGCRSSRQFQGSVFAFPNKDDQCDILALFGSKLVYESTDTVFALDGDKVVLKSPEQVVVSSRGKSVFVNEPCCRHHH